MIPPVVDPDSAPFWEALDRDELVVPFCRSGSHQFFPPMPRCPICGSTDLTWTRVTGTVRAYSWVRIHIPLSPAFADEAPYTIVVADLPGGGRLAGRLLDEVKLDDGSPLRFATYRVDDQALPGFRAVHPEGDATP
jgi:uncharacterized protein